MKILAFAEQREGVLKKTAFEVVRTARGLADKLSAEAVALVVGDGIEQAASELARYGAHRILVVQDARLKNYSTTAYSKIVADVATKEDASVVLFSATSMGKDCAPRVAVRLEAGLVSDCVALKVESNDIIAARPVYAGKALIDVRVTSSKRVFTIRPNVFSAGSPDGASARVQKIETQIAENDFASAVQEITHAKGKIDVAEADIIVTGGRGLKGPENFGMIEELAAAFGGAVGASRAVVDAGWRPHDEQVGQTGKTVSPSLYVAVAVSGAIQHLAGMSSSKYIVAINKDKDAPIFQVTDYGIVGDAFEVVPALTKEVNRLKGK